MRSLKNSILTFCIVLINVMLLCFPENSIGQSKAAARYEIDAKRIDVYPEDKDALPRSREFLRLDSTYYVGWMYEGLYKYEHSADRIGYRNSIDPLYKALNLLDKDFGSVLRQLYTNIGYYTQNQKYYDDLHSIAYALMQCYNSIEMPDSTMKLLEKIERYNFQKDFFYVYNNRAWAYHRNRFFTSKDFAFLKNSIEENEALAFKSCYEQIGLIKKHKNENDQWFGWNQSQMDYLNVYHYLAILHNYNGNYDSSRYYYEILADGNMVSWGNYAHLEEELGNFRKAFDYYIKPQYSRKQALNEEDYYLPSLLVYGARTKDAIRGCRLTIESRGSTPGFGWYTIALARSYLYDGQLDSCEFFLDKAANFKELHINTTLTQSQYEFTINLLRIQLLEKKTQLVKFFNPGWWYSPSDLYDVVLLKAEKLMLEYAVVNALSYNPERHRMIYDLFCGESTVTYDESMFLLKEFSLPFFIEKYENYQLNDKRKKIRRYFKYFVAKFKYENGDKEVAARECEKILNEFMYGSKNEEDVIDENCERLLLARLCEVIASYHERGDEAQRYSEKMLEQFPQLAPFSGVKMKIHLTISGQKDEEIQKVLREINDCNFELTSKSSGDIPDASIQFLKKGDVYEAVINSRTGSGRVIALDQRLIFKTADGVGKELALRLFGKGGVVKWEPEAYEPVALK